MCFLTRIFKRRERIPYTENALGHNHEWDELWFTDEDGNRKHKEGWVYCEVCGTHEEIKNI